MWTYTHTRTQKTRCLQVAFLHAGKNGLKYGGRVWGGDGAKEGARRSKSESVLIACCGGDDDDNDGNDNDGKDKIKVSFATHTHTRCSADLENYFCEPTTYIYVYIFVEAHTALSHNRCFQAFSLFLPNKFWLLLFYDEFFFLRLLFLVFSFFSFYICACGRF